MQMGPGSAEQRYTLHRVRDTRALPLMHRARGGAVTADQVGYVETGDRTVRYHPVAADHHPIGAMRAAKHQRGQGVAVAGETQLIELEQGEVGGLADRDFAELGA